MATSLCLWRFKTANICVRNAENRNALNGCFDDMLKTALRMHFIYVMLAFEVPTLKECNYIKNTTTKE